MEKIGIWHCGLFIVYPFDTWLDKREMLVMVFEEIP